MFLFKRCTFASMDYVAAVSRNATVPYKPHLLEARLKTRCMVIAVKGAATGSIDRSRCNTSATSTCDREAYDGNQGWGGGISCGCSHLCLLTKEASPKQSENQLSFLTSIEQITTSKPTTSVSFCRTIRQSTPISVRPVVHYAKPVHSSAVIGLVTRYRRVDEQVTFIVRPYIHASLLRASLPTR